MKTHQLALKQLDRQLEPWLQSKAFFQPRRGWVATLRKALGMTLPQLARKLDVARSRVIKIQQAELSGSLTIRSLKETANALNCDLVYALVPKQPLQTLLRNQAEKVARLRLQRVSHSMALEDQEVAPPQQKDQLEELINALLLDNLKYLWEEKN